MGNKEGFLRIYANLPLSQRTEIIVVMGGEPLTWNSARVEIENDTEKGIEILEKLTKMGILK